MNTTDILKKIRKIEITTKNLVSDIFSGEYQSIFKGQGIEFSEVREYQEGDSYRQIDWNVTARMGTPYIKKFEETRELNVFFLIDTSASTLFGTQNYLKHEYIAEISAILSFSALSNNDKVSLALFSNEIEKYIPPRKGKKSALRIIRDILYAEPKNVKTDLNQALEFVYRIAKKKSIIFIISDFFDNKYETNLKLLAKKHDVVAIRIMDPSELTLPNVGLLDLYDPETNDTFTVNTSNKKIRENFNKLARIEEERIEEFFKKMRIDHLNILTNQSYIKELMKFFKKRMSRKNNV